MIMICMSTIDKVYYGIHIMSYSYEIIVQWNLQITDTSGAGTLSVVERRSSNACFASYIVIVYINSFSICS